MDCENLAIIHAEYPKRFTSIQSVQTQQPEAAVQPEVSEWAFLRNIYLPTEPSAEQIAIVEAAITAEFESVFDQEDGLGTLAGPEMMIQLRDDAVPYYVNGARPTPFSERAEVKSTLDRLVAKRVIVPVTDALE